jgi:hypothetical protein
MTFSLSSPFPLAHCTEDIYLAFHRLFVVLSLPGNAAQAKAFPTK